MPDMKMTINKVDDAAAFFDALHRDRKAFGLHTIDNVNWPEHYPARPEVHFAIAHTGGSILLKYFVDEEYTLATVIKDNGPVWTDSCVEFFIGLDDSGYYYNLECTCIGTTLLGLRKQRDVFTRADQNVIDTIRRRPSLGVEPFAEKRGPAWDIEIEIPVSAFFRHDIGDISGMSTRGNFYKCGDNLTVPHFLSWNPIDNPKPDFHLEKFFGRLEFEQEQKIV